MQQPDRPGGRYGDRPTRPRPAVLALVVVVAALFAAWVVWAGLGAAAPEPGADVTAFRVVSDAEIEVRVAATSGSTGALRLQRAGPGPHPGGGGRGQRDLRPGRTAATGRWVTVRTRRPGGHGDRRALLRPGRRGGTTSGLGTYTGCLVSLEGSPRPGAAREHGSTDPAHAQEHAVTETHENVTWLTQEAYDRLKEELDYLSGEGRLEMSRRIEQAREEGDLARERRLPRRQGRAGEARGAHPPAPAAAGVGTGGRGPQGALRRRGPRHVVTAKVGGEEMRFLLGSREVAGDGIEVYSERSPLGEAINGKHTGESAIFKAPNGNEVKVEVVDDRAVQPADGGRGRPPAGSSAAGGPTVEADRQRDEHREDAGDPEQRVDDRVLHRPHVLRRQRRAGVAELLARGLGDRARSGSSRRTPAAAPAGSRRGRTCSR